MASLSPADEDGDGFSTCDDDCDDTDPFYTPTDADGDGFSTCDDDCDDSDASLNIDDEDGDGFSTCDGDCDDTNLLAFPGAGFREMGDYITTSEEGDEIVTALAEMCLLDADLDGYGDQNPPEKTFLLEAIVMMLLLSAFQVLLNSILKHFV